VGVCDVTEVVLVCRVAVVFKAVNDGGVVVAVVRVRVRDDEDDVVVVVLLTVFVGASSNWSLRTANVSSLRYLGRGGTAGFRPVFVGLGFVGVT